MDERILSFCDARREAGGLASQLRLARVMRRNLLAQGSAQTVMSRERLDGLVSWRAARALAAAVHRATSGASFETDPELRAALRSAATEVMTAIAEGYEQRTCGEFERRLAAAAGAAARLNSLICLAGDMGLLAREVPPRLRRRVEETAELVDALRQVVTRYQQLQVMPAPPRVN